LKKCRKLAGVSVLPDQLSRKADLAFRATIKIETGPTFNINIDTVKKYPMTWSKNGHI